MRAAVVVFPGSTCDRDAHYVLADLLGVETDLIWHEDMEVSRYDLVVLPGGFTYGDYLRAGAIARFSPAVRALARYVRTERGLVLGICNGFQILCEAGLLPGTLAKNAGSRFICRNVALRVENPETPLTRLLPPGGTVHFPIAHGEGRYVIDAPGLSRLRKNRQILFTYLENPNGSVAGIAGVMDEGGRVFGLMPHPERNAEALLGSGEGILLFRSLIESWDG